MRHILLFLVPALIVAGLAFALLRARRSTAKNDDDGDMLSDPGIVLVVLIGAVLAVVLVVSLSS